MDSWIEYVDLLSDASRDLYPDNHGSHFTNKFPVPLDIQDGAKVGLAEIQFVNSWYNVSLESNSINVFDFTVEYPPGHEKNPLPATHSLWGEFRECTFKEGYYTSYEDFKNMLNDSLKQSQVEQLKDKDIFTYDPLSGKFAHDVQGLYLTIFLRGPISNFLGAAKDPQNMEDYVLLGKSKKSTTYTYVDPANPSKTEIRHFVLPSFHWGVSQGPTDIFEYVAQLTLFSSFVVYIDILQSQITGDTYSDALRIVSINKKDPGSSSVIQYDKPYFLRLNKYHIPTITVQIRTLEGKFVDFKVGRTRLKLKFVYSKTS